jgi:serine/threonine-protein kinase
MARVFTITEGLENMGALKTGGQGSVYKGRRIGEIITAVKLLPTPIHSESPDDKNFRDFQNEVQKLKKVNEQPNPNVVKILSSGITETGNLPFIEMEFIEGPDLEELLKPPRDPVFTIKETIKLAEQLSHALAHCHKVYVKHGDIKSNNVKLNTYTGNYVLLDFGLAVMSDEQRRTSLRHAGAIEFMAPEQNEGQMLFPTDVYSFGIILFELLAGVVPFPLKDKGETARNMVMVAHMETPPPSILSLRKQNLPQSWSDEKKEREMNVPPWLVSMVRKCLEKKPEDRFQNGMELHDYVVLNSTLASGKNEWNAGRVDKLQQENEKLVKEKQQLQQLLLQYQDAPGYRGEEIAALKNSLAQKESEVQSLKHKLTIQQQNEQQSGISTSSLIAMLLLMFGLGVFVAYNVFDKDQPATNSQEEKPAKPDVQKPPQQRKVTGQYKVQAPKAYFHNEPDESTRRGAYMVPSEDVIEALEEKNGFIYTEFTNSKGITSKGWLRKEDLMTLDEWTKKNNEQVLPLSKIEINAQLQRAKAFLDNNNTEAAVTIYRTLSEQDVPEAMYHYGDLALQNKNDDLDCASALDLVKKAGDMNYTEAKRTLGFLYLFADNKDILRATNYDHCTYPKSIVKGTQLLMDAMIAGDTAASRILELHKYETRENGQ